MQDLPGTSRNSSFKVNFLTGAGGFSVLVTAGIMVTIGFILLAFFEAQPLNTGWMKWLPGVWTLLMMAAMGWTLYQDAPHTFVVLLLAPIVARLLTRGRTNVLDILAQSLSQRFMIRSLWASITGLIGLWVATWATQDHLIGLYFGAILYAVIAFDLVSDLVNSPFWALLGIIGPVVGQVVAPKGTWLLISLINALIYVFGLLVPRKWSQPVQVFSVIISVLALGLIRNGFVIDPILVASRSLSIALMIIVWNGLLVLAFQVHRLTRGAVRWLATPGIPCLLSILGLNVSSFIAVIPALLAALVFFGAILLFRFVNIWLANVPFYGATQTITEFDRFENSIKRFLGRDLYDRTKWLITGDLEGMGPSARRTVQLLSIGLVSIGVFLVLLYTPAMKGSSSASPLLISLPILVCARVISGWWTKFRVRLDRRLTPQEASDEVTELILAVFVSWLLLRSQSVSVMDLGMAIVLSLSVRWALIEDLTQVNFGRFATFAGVAHGLVYLLFTALLVHTKVNWFWTLILGSLAGFLRSVHQHADDLAAKENQRAPNRNLGIRLSPSFLAGGGLTAVLKKEIDIAAQLMVFLGTAFFVERLSRYLHRARPKL